MRLSEVVPRMVGAASEPAEVVQGDHLGSRFYRLDDAGVAREWLRRHARGLRGNLAIVAVRGDSMEPTLLDGESIVIDVRDASVDAAGIYAFEVEGRLLVKRLQHRTDGSLAVISDNHRYASELLPRGWQRELRVVGRMVMPQVW